MENQVDLRGVPFMFAAAAWLGIYRVAVNRGFTLKRNGVSTDGLFGVVIGVSAMVWTVVVLVLGDEIADVSVRGWLSRSAHVPWIVMEISVLQLLLWIDVKWAEKYRHGETLLWNLNVASGPFSWSKCIHSVLFWGFAAITTVVVTGSSVSVILEGHKTQGILSLIGLSIFFLSGAGPNPFPEVHHQYSADSLRVVSPTNEHEGAVYILPSSGRGFDAVWSPKIQNEHTEADERALTLFASIRAGKWSLKTPLERIRHIVTAYQERVTINSSELEALARWLYLDDSENAPNMRPIRCMRTEGTHLIGRELMYALCHAEYLVFKGQGRLPLEQQRKIGFLRVLKRGLSGVSSEMPFSSECIGYKAGMAGYRDAVHYIYRLFDEPLDELALQFGCAPPKYSCTLGYAPRSIEEYVSELWTVCCQHSESTFTALYMFTLVWSMELGNCNGFDLFPLKCRNRNGDLVSQQMVWRQVWYEGVICQLVSSSLLLFGAFAAGYLG